MSQAVAVRRAVAADRALLARLLQRLYDRLGIPRHATPFYRLSGEDLKKLAAG